MTATFYSTMSQDSTVVIVRNVKLKITVRLFSRIFVLGLGAGAGHLVINFGVKFHTFECFRGSRSVKEERTRHQMAPRRVGGVFRSHLGETVDILAQGVFAKGFDLACQCTCVQNIDVYMHSSV